VSTSKLQIVRINAHRANRIHTQSKYCRKSNDPTVVWLRWESGWWTSNNIAARLLISGCSTDDKTWRRLGSRSACRRTIRLGGSPSDRSASLRRAGLGCARLDVACRQLREYRSDDRQSIWSRHSRRTVQKVRMPALSAPGVDVADLLQIVDEVKPVAGEPVIRKPRMNPLPDAPICRSSRAGVTATRFVSR
jgi:hypothetical protein